MGGVESRGAPVTGANHDADNIVQSDSELEHSKVNIPKKTPSLLELRRPPRLEAPASLKEKIRNSFRSPTHMYKPTESFVDEDDVPLEAATPTTPSAFFNKMSKGVRNSITKLSAFSPMHYMSQQMLQLEDFEDDTPTAPLVYEEVRDRLVEVLLKYDKTGSHRISAMTLEKMIAKLNVRGRGKIAIIKRIMSKCFEENNMINFQGILPGYDDSDEGDDSEDEREEIRIEVDPQRRIRFIEEVTPAGNLKRKLAGVYDLAVRGCHVSSAVKCEKLKVVLSTTSVIGIQWECSESKKVKKFEVQWKQSKGKKDEFDASAFLLSLEKEKEEKKEEDEVETEVEENKETENEEKKMEEEEKEADDDLVEEVEPPKLPSLEDLVEVWSTVTPEGTIYKERKYGKRNQNNSSPSERSGTPIPSTSPVPGDKSPAVVGSPTRSPSTAEEGKTSPDTRIALDESVEPERDYGEIRFVCDDSFCTIPTRIVRRYDSRGEIILHGLSSDSPALSFRVRAKVDSGWGPWSQILEDIKPLDDEIDAPRANEIRAHRIGLKWDNPFEDIDEDTEVPYEKVLTFDLYGRRAGSLDRRFYHLFHCDGSHHHCTIRNLFSLANPTSENKQDSLGSNTAFIFMMKSVIGKWYRGCFYTSKLESGECLLRTSPAFVDAVQNIYVVPYRGAVTPRSIHLHWDAPTTYGEGYNFSAHRLARETEWISMQSLEEGTLSDAIQKDPKLKLTLAELNAWIRQSEALSSEDPIPKWCHRVTKEIVEGHENEPCCNFDISPIDYVVYAKPVANQEDDDEEEDISPPLDKDGNEWTEFLEICRSHNATSYQVGGSDALQQLSPNTEYLFKIATVNVLGIGPQSLPFKYKTANLELVTHNKGTFAELPPGWLEAWDPVTEWMFYYNNEKGISQWEHPGGLLAEDDPLRPFRMKRFKIHHTLKLKYPEPKDYSVLKLNDIDRKNILDQSFSSMRFLPIKEFLQPTKISFKDEAGIDSGGITAEWYLLLSRSFFAEHHCFFIRCEDAEGSLYTIDRRSRSKSNKELPYYVFYGKLLAKAIYDNRLIDAPLSNHIFHYLIASNTISAENNISYFKEIDPVKWKSLNWILENDITNVLTESFSICTDEFGAQKEIDIITNGRNIAVTEENKVDYVHAIIQWQLYGSILPQLQAMQNGFSQIISSSSQMLSDFTPSELRLLLNGIETIDVDELRCHTHYSGGYEELGEQDETIQIFWQHLFNCNQEQLKDLLVFVTGCSRIPIHGFSFNIMRSNDATEKSIETLENLSEEEIDASKGIPRSHTCFSQLILPPYCLPHILKQKLKLAIDEAHESGFQLT